VIYARSRSYLSSLYRLLFFDTMPVHTYAILGLHGLISAAKPWNTRWREADVCIGLEIKVRVRSDVKEGR